MATKSPPPSIPLSRKQLPSLGIAQQHVAFTHVTMQSEKFVCVRETAGQNSVVVVDMADPTRPLRRPITAESALMHPEKKVLALKATLPGGAGGSDSLQVFDLDSKQKLKSHQMAQPVVHWAWLDGDTLGLVTAASVFHWTISGGAEPVKVFDRAANLGAGAQIISYRASPDKKWLVLVGISPGDAARPQLVRGAMQLYSVEQGRSQSLEAHAASFGQVTLPGNAQPSQLIAFAQKTAASGQHGKLHVIELGQKPGQTPFQKRQAELFFPPEFADDFPVSMQVSKKYGLVYVITKLGLLFVYDLATATAIYRSRVSSDPVFLTCEDAQGGGFFAINRRGQVLRAEVVEAAVVPFVAGQLNNLELALDLARRGNLPGAEALVGQSFERLFALGQLKEAAEAAATSPQGVLRTRETLERFKALPAQAGQPSPLLQYFGVLLQKGKLNQLESVELAKLVLAQNKKQLLLNWMGEEKLEPSEELGDLLKSVGDLELALQVYMKGQCTSKVVAVFAERGQFEELVKFSSAAGFAPDYLHIMQTLLMSNAAAAVKLAQMLATQDPPAMDLNTLADLFLQRNMIREATSFLLEALKPNLPEQALLQTKVLEINLLTFPNVADAILANGMFTHYDRLRVAQLSEKAGLYLRALQHYTELSDIKRVMANAHAIDPTALTEFCGTLEPEWVVECLKELLAANLQLNLQIVVQVAKEHAERVGEKKIIALLEDHKATEGLFFFIGSFIARSEDPEVHYKYIEAAAQTGQLKEVDRITRESNHYDPEQVKRFLMEAKLQDSRPLINVCDRFDLVQDLTQYLYQNNMLRFIEAYVQKVNPSRAPEVVGALLDLECEESFITNLILSVRSLLPVEPLVLEVEKRNCLGLLQAFLDHLVNEGSQDPHVHNALGKIAVESNTNPEHFLTTNPYYDSLVVGKFCEKRDPNLACVAYKRGQCDQALVECTSKNQMFKMQARYAVERMEPELWESVLQEDNPERRQLIDQVVSTALPESKNPEQVSVTVKAFMQADLPNELIELLEKIVLQNSAFSGNPNLQNLLILTAIKADKERVGDYVNRLDSFDGPAVGEIAVGAELYEEAFAIYKKFDLHVQAVQVLLENLGSFDRAREYAAKIEQPEVWSALAQSQIETGAADAEMVSEAIAAYIRANDSSKYQSVIEAAKKHSLHADLVKYLVMTRKRVKDKIVDSELAAAYATTGRLAELEEFLTQPHGCDVLTVGERCFEEGNFEGARVLFSQVSAWGRLASTLVHLGLFQQAVDAARKANSPKTWKEVCFACVEKEEFRLAQLCGLSIIVQADELEEVAEFYQARGRYDELISLMESGLGLERSHMGIFTELGILYAKYRPEKLMEHLKLFAARLNIPRLIRVCEEQCHWPELVHLYVQYDEYDNAAGVMMEHSPDAWEHVLFKDVCGKVSNSEVHYRALQFYLDEHPDLLNNLLETLTPRLDHARVVDLMRKAEHLPLVKPYLVAVQPSNLAAVNEALNGLLIEEEDFEGLRASIDAYDAFDQVGLAQVCESHELIEFRRVASHLYKRNLRWRQSVEMSKRDKLYKDAMETAAQSKDDALAGELLEFFVKGEHKECFAACLYHCYDLIRPDKALEMAWMNGMTDFAMPYLIQSLRDYASKVDSLVSERDDARAAAKKAQNSSANDAAQSNMYAQMMPPALPAPAMPGQSSPGMMPPGGYGGQTF